MDEQIAAYITQAAGISVRDTARHLSIPKSNVAHALVRLKQAGRVEFDGEGWLRR